MIKTFYDAAAASYLAANKMCRILECQYNFYFVVHPAPAQP